MHENGDEGESKDVYCVLTGMGLALWGSECMNVTSFFTVFLLI